MAWKRQWTFTHWRSDNEENNNDNFLKKRLFKKTGGRKCPQKIMSIQLL